MPFDALTTRTPSTARLVSPNAIVLTSPVPSPFGVSTRGTALRPVTASGGGPGTGSVDGRTASPALIVYV